MTSGRCCASQAAISSSSRRSLLQNALHLVLAGLAGRCDEHLVGSDLVVLEGVVGDAALEHLVTGKQAGQLLRRADDLAEGGLQPGRIRPELMQAALHPLGLAVRLIEMRAHFARSSG